MSTSAEQITQLIGGYTDLKAFFEADRNSRDQFRADVNAQVAAKMAEVDTSLHNHAILRQSPNQYGNLDANGDLDGWVKNGSFNVSFSHVRDVSTGTPFADRPVEDQAVLDAMGRSGAQHFMPTIRVLRVDWSGALAGAPQWLLYPNQMWSGGMHVSVGSYARLLSGNCYGQVFEGITADWGECGLSWATTPGMYQHPHPYVTTESGSVEFFWPALVHGAVKFDRNNPRWGYYASPYGTQNRDTAA
ncbi:MAG: hypothetical protein ACJAVZ_000082 [Afipia broomeae]|jgi:hypothetical protein